MKKSNISSPLARRLLAAMGENIRMARLRRDLSLQSVAQRAGLSINTVVAVERGSEGAGMGAVANILQVLGLAEDMILLAKDDVLGRKLQDLELRPRKRAPRTNDFKGKRA